MERRTIFGHQLLTMSLVVPQFLLTLIFFLWPACQAVWSSLTRQDPFGLHTQFAGFDNFVELFTEPPYRESIGRTVFFMIAVSVLSMSLALFLAVFADREIGGRTIYRTLLIWPYAVAPAMAAVLWILL